MRKGTVSGNGGALVVLAGAGCAGRRRQYSCLDRGSAINNDGADKADHRAQNGQAEVIREAHDLAGVDRPPSLR